RRGPLPRPHPRLLRAGLTRPSAPAPRPAPTPPPRAKTPPKAKSVRSWYPDNGHKKRTPRLPHTVGGFDGEEEWRSAQGSEAILRSEERRVGKGGRGGGGAQAA